MSRNVRDLRFRTSQPTLTRAQRRRRSSRPGVEGLESRALLTTMIGLTNANSLITFDSSSPGTIQNTIPITGLLSGESAVSIASRSFNGALLALGSNSHLYTIKLGSGAATPVSSTAFSPTIVGGRFAISVDPVTDLVRLVDDSQQNQRINPTTGVVTSTDPLLVYANGDANAAKSPNLVALASSNSFPGATSTTDYSIDSTLGNLVRIGSVGGSPMSPNASQVSTIGTLGVSVTDAVGLDIINATNTAFAALTPFGTTVPALYTINLTTGTATKVGTIGAGTTTLLGLSASTVSAPSAPNLLAASDSGVSNSDHITNVSTPVITGTASPNRTIIVSANGVQAGTGTADAFGNYAIKLSPALADGTYTVFVNQIDASGVSSPASPNLSPALVIKTSAPTPGVPILFTSSDNGFSTTDHFTRVNAPQFFGGGEVGDTVSLFANGTLIARGPVQSVAQYALQSITLADGTYQVTASETDVAGNTSGLSAALSPPLIIDTSGRPTPGQAFVNQLYLDLLGRPADQSAFDHWVPIAYVPNGRPVVVQGIISSLEYRQAVVASVYQTLLHRAPEASAVTIGANYLLTHTNEQLRAILAGSGEYYKLHGNTNTTYLAALYQDILGRPIDPAGQAKYLSLLNGGASIQVIAFTILQSQEGFAATSSSIYQELLHRAPDSASLANMVSILSSGGRDEDIITILASSPEYYRNARGSDVVINQWGMQAYQDLLGRAADPAGLALVTAQLNQGQSPSMVIQSLQGTDEYRVRVVNQAYATVLGRSPDPGGLAAGVALLAAGGTLASLEANLFGSQEYFVVAGGGTNAGFLASIYQDILGRTIDPGAAAAGLNALASGVSRTAIASSLVLSIESSQRTVQSLYMTYLRRAANFTEVTTLAANLSNGSLSSNNLIAALIGSSEYFAGL